MKIAARILFSFIVMSALSGSVLRADPFDVSTPQDESYILLVQWVQKLEGILKYNQSHSFLSTSYSFLEVPKFPHQESELMGKALTALIEVAPQVASFTWGTRQLFLKSSNFPTAIERLSLILANYKLQQSSELGFCTEGKVDHSYSDTYFDSYKRAIAPLPPKPAETPEYYYDDSGRRKKSLPVPVVKLTLPDACRFEGAVVFRSCRLGFGDEHGDHRYDSASGWTLFANDKFLQHFDFKQDALNAMKSNVICSGLK